MKAWSFDIWSTLPGGVAGTRGCVKGASERVLQATLTPTSPALLRELNCPACVVRPDRVDFMPVPSNPLPLGTRLPWFRLTDLDGVERSASDVSEGQIAIVAFICNHSPYVRHIEDQLSTALNRFQREGMYVVAISPNDVISYPSDSVDEMRSQAERGVRFEFPYCLDESQEVTKAFQAACTPEVFVYDSGWRLAYHGQFDGSRPSAANGAAVTGDSLDEAIESIRTGEALSARQMPSLGCSVKWRSGNEPDYVLAIPDQRWIIDVA